MKQHSIWLDNIELNNCSSIDKDMECDILLVGGGITGLSIAYQLRNKGLKVCLAEKNLIGHGVTARTTGKITYLQETVYSDITKYYNLATTKLYLESQIDAINLITDIIKEEKIDCSFNKVDSYVFTFKKEEIPNIKKEKNILEQLGIKVNSANTLPDNTKVAYGISVTNTAVFHPLKYLIKLKEILLKNNINIYENTCITKIEKEADYYLCYANNYKIKAKKVVYAAHYPYFIFPYLTPLKTHLEKSYIMAYKVKQNDYFSAITNKIPTLSIRYLDNDKNIYKLVLSESHNLAIKYNEKSNFSSLLTNIDTIPDYMWSNKDIMTSDKMPLIGAIDNNFYIATGYNTWGMTNATIAGKIISDELLGLDNKYKTIFDPKRSIKNKLINYPLNIVSSIKPFIENKIYKNKTWYKDNIRFTKDLGIYTDESGCEHIVYNRCPHFKCSLIFNEEEKTWDCPCHGSRFDIDGHCLEGPSNFDIAYKG